MSSPNSAGSMPRRARWSPARSRAILSRRRPPREPILRMRRAALSHLPSRRGRNGRTNRHPTAVARRSGWLFARLFFHVRNGIESSRLARAACVGREQRADVSHSSGMPTGRTILRPVGREHASLPARPGRTRARDHRAFSPNARRSRFTSVIRPRWGLPTCDVPTSARP